MRQVLGHEYTLGPRDIGTHLYHTTNRSTRVALSDFPAPIGSRISITLEGFGTFRVDPVGVSLTPNPVVVRLQGTTLHLTRGHRGWIASEQSASQDAGGLSPADIAVLEDICVANRASAMTVLHKGRTAFEYAVTPAALTDNRTLNSVRKAITALLIGNAIHRGLLSLDTTMQDLGIVDGAGDNDPLTVAEQQATVENCLQSRSGIYHPSSNDANINTSNRPARGTYGPGEHYWYNNWDFNVLQSIYEMVTGEDYFEAIGDVIGSACRFEDYDPAERTIRTRPDDSVYPTYFPRLSARDRAKVGQLILQRGFINGIQVVPRDFMDKMWTPYSALSSSGFGYCWNVGILPSGNSIPGRSPTYGFRSGTGGQRIYVLPHRDMAIGIVNRPSYHSPSGTFNGSSRLLNLLTGGTPVVDDEDDEDGED